MELFFYPHAGTGNPTGKILRVRVRVRVSTTRRVCTRCHLEEEDVRLLLLHLYVIELLREKVRPLA
jgi:hypothetical protein